MEPVKRTNTPSHLDVSHGEHKDLRPTILLGIDGTGELFDDDYAKAFANSHVNRIIRDSPHEMKHYIRGPFTDGVDMMALVGKGYEFVHLHKFDNPDTKVLLTGYSRGAAGVIAVAQKLKRDGVIVDAMILFDPVNRSQTSSADDVSNNVLNMVQARRATRGYSRVSFNNCGVTWHSPTKCEIQYFWATHGGVGGTPWPLKGHGPKEYIDEGAGELLLTDTVYHPGQIHPVLGLLAVDWEQPRDYNGTLEQLEAERSKIGNRTQITYEQDRWGSDSVWQWMYPRLLRFGFLKKTK